MSKTGILIINLGTPDTPTVPAVRKYLKQFLLDRRVIDIPWLQRNALVRFIIAPFRAKASTKIYKQLWTENGSPLKYYGHEVEKLLQQKMGDNIVVKLGMRYQNPSIGSALEEIRKSNVGKIVVFTMFPQYASASTGSALEEAMKVISEWQTIPELHLVSSYHDNQDMIQIYADNARKKGLQNYDHFLFSFHGIPQRQLIKADCNNLCLQSKTCCEKLSDFNKMCYSAQCYNTAQLIAKELNLDKSQYSVSFQSRLGKEPWTEPFTPDKLKELYEKGLERLLVFSPSFTADCLETTVEIGIEYQEEFEKMGGKKLDLVESLNANPAWIDAIFGIINKHV